MSTAALDAVCAAALKRISQFINRTARAAGAAHARAMEKTRMNTLPPDLERISAEAQKAAWLYDHINDACPYPFGSAEARAFRTAFDAAKAALAAQAPGVRGVAA